MMLRRNMSQYRTATFSQFYCDIIMKLSHEVQGAQHVQVSRLSVARHL